MLEDVADWLLRLSQSLVIEERCAKPCYYWYKIDAKRPDTEMHTVRLYTLFVPRTSPGVTYLVGWINKPTPDGGVILVGIIQPVFHQPFIVADMLLLQTHIYYSKIITNQRQ